MTLAAELSMAEGPDFESRCRVETCITLHHNKFWEVSSHVISLKSRDLIEVKVGGSYRYLFQSLKYPDYAHPFRSSLMRTFA